MLRREVLPIRQPRMLPLCASGFALSIAAALLIGRVERAEVASSHSHAHHAPSAPHSRAEILYRAKRFADAASVLRAAAPSLDAHNARDVRALASVYASLGEAYDRGMAADTPPVDRFEALERARVLDRVVGGAFVADIEAALAIVTPRAAIVYAAHHGYDAAVRAVRIADTLGVDDNNVHVVKRWLADEAQRRAQR